MSCHTAIPLELLPPILSGTNFARTFCACFACQNRGFRRAILPSCGHFSGPPEQIFWYPPGWRGHIVPSHPLKKLGNSCRKRSGASVQDLCRTLLGYPYRGSPGHHASACRRYLWERRHEQYGWFLQGYESQGTHAWTSHTSTSDTAIRHRLHDNPSILHPRALVCFMIARVKVLMRVRQQSQQEVWASKGHLHI